MLPICCSLINMPPSGTIREWSWWSTAKWRDLPWTCLFEKFPSANNCQIYFSIYYRLPMWFIKAAGSCFLPQLSEWFHYHFWSWCCHMLCKMGAAVLFGTEVSSSYQSLKSRLSFSSESLISSFSCERQMQMRVCFDSHRQGAVIIPTTRLENPIEHLCVFQAEQNGIRWTWNVDVLHIIELRDVKYFKNFPSFIFPSFRKLLYF